MIDLLPCPFCGREPRHTSRGASPSERSTTGEMHFIACYGGGHSAHAHQFGYSYNEVAERWNTRSGPYGMTEHGVAGVLGVFVKKAGGVRALAKVWGVSPSHISDVVNGRRGPGPAILEKLGLTRRVTERFVPDQSAPLFAASTPDHP